MHSCNLNSLEEGKNLKSEIYVLRLPGVKMQGQLSGEIIVAVEYNNTKIFRDTACLLEAETLKSKCHMLRRPTKDISGVMLPAQLMLICRLLAPRHRGIPRYYVLRRSE